VLPSKLLYKRADEKEEMTAATDIESSYRQLDAIASRARDFECSYAADIAAVHTEFCDSARNLVHYLALRHEDLRELQESLASLGLSSLGRAERNVMTSIRMVQNALARMSGRKDLELVASRDDLRLRSLSAQLHKKAIFGADSDGREVSIMVTLPTDAGSKYSLVAAMIETGMNVARINCGHDNQEVWAGMIANVRKASRETGRECRILMDLSGPKLRTGGLLPGPQVIHVRPRRNALGNVVKPRTLRLVAGDVLWRGKTSQVLPVPRQFIESARQDDIVRLKDARGKKRKLRVIERDANSIVLEICKGTYVVSGTKLRLICKESVGAISCNVGELPSIEQAIYLRTGDTLILHQENIPGGPAILDADGNVAETAHISCQQTEIFSYVSDGDPIWLNDGKIAGLVRSASDDKIEIEITRAKTTGSRLRSNCGINLPQSTIRLPALTEADKANLAFVTSHADTVCLSFVRRPADIVSLQEELKKFPDKHPGLMVKIETSEGFINLPRVLLATMRSYPAAIMIARGDLAVECGWERLAELQEEILWLCESANLPVIWATEVLQQEARKGHPSRAEITDAAMSQRADCVMLNKGPHILAAINMLDNILRRMQDHQYKKTARLRKLSITDLTKTN
jgi:pyruvate kinase